MRTTKSIKNISVGVLGQLLTTILTFLNRTVFIYILGSTYLGINGLFSNLLSVLSLAELGVGSAIIFNLYKPLAEKNETKIIALMKYYEKAYRNIGIFIGILGILILPFLNYIIYDKEGIDNLYLIFILFLMDSVTSYFIAYKRSILTADQKNYINVINQQLFNIIKTLIQIVVLLISKNFIVYLIVQILCTLVSNIIISRKVDFMYPYLKNHSNIELDLDSRKRIIKDVKALMCQKIGTVVVGGTDNILISTFIGVKWVGLYSNYLMIVNMINSFLNQIVVALTASVGNLNATEDEKKIKEIFHIIFFMNNWIYSFCSITLLILLNPFIEIWIGEDYLLDNSAVFLIVINFFIKGMRQPTIMYSNTLGLFWQERYKSIIEAIINLIVSIIMLRNFGIMGVFLGTFVSTMTTCFWYEPYVVYKYGFKKNCLDYFKRYSFYLLATGMTSFITYFLCSYIDVTSFIDIMKKLLICIFTSNFLFLIIFRKTEEFKFLLKKYKKMFRVIK